MTNNARHTIAAIALATALAAAPALADVKAGVDAWEAGRFEQAVKEWRALADRGDADAQFNMGQAYRLGRGVPADLKSRKAGSRRPRRRAIRKRRRTPGCSCSRTATARARCHGCARRPIAATRGLSTCSAPLCSTATSRPRIGRALTPT
jgi:hypothetical protein